MDTQNLNILQSFQISKDMSGKLDYATGEKIANQIRASVTDTNGYFLLRNIRFAFNRSMCDNTYDMSRFRDRLGFTGELKFINLSYLPFSLVNTIISRKVGSWMGRGEKIEFKATDTQSNHERVEQYNKALFNLMFGGVDKELEEASGVPSQKDGSFEPEDEEHLNIWAEEENRLAEEIIAEKVSNDVLDEFGFFDVLKEKILHDAAELGLVCGQRYLDRNGKLKIHYINPSYFFYSKTEFPDFRDCAWMGQQVFYKISKIRKLYGVEFGGTLTEEDLFKIVQTTSQYQSTTGLFWDSGYISMYQRPYDDFTAVFIEFEYKSVDAQIMDVTVSPKGKLISNQLINTASGMHKALTEKMQGKPSGNVLKSTLSNIKNQNKDKLSKEHISKIDAHHSSIGKNEDIDDDRVNGILVDVDNCLNECDANKKHKKPIVNIYKGVLARDTEIMVEWGLAKNIARPTDEDDKFNAYFSYCAYMYQNNSKMKNIAIPEKVQQPFEQMIMMLLRMEQLVTTMKPPGSAINTTAMRSMDFGLGDAQNAKINPKDYYNQTGDIYYNGLDDEGKPIPIPIQELANNGFAPQMQSLIAGYHHWYSILKDALGEDPNLVSAASQPRVTSENVQASIQMSDNATDYMYDAYLYLMEQFAKGIPLLIGDSIKFGSKAYRAIVGEKDLSVRSFKASCKMKPNGKELATLEALMNTAIASNPALIKYLDPFKVMSIAKDNLKLAQQYFVRCQRKCLVTEQAINTQNSQMNGQIQQQSIADKKDADLTIIEAEDQSKSRITLLQGYVDLIGKGIQPTEDIHQMATAIMTNMATPLALENMKNQQIMAQVQGQMQQEQQQQGGEQQPQQPPQEQQMEQQQPQ